MTVEKIKRSEMVVDGSRRDGAHKSAVGVYMVHMVRVQCDGGACGRVCVASWLTG